MDRGRGGGEKVKNGSGQGGGGKTVIGGRRGWDCFLTLGRSSVNGAKRVSNESASIYDGGGAKSISHFL